MLDLDPGAGYNSVNTAMHSGICSQPLHQVVQMFVLMIPPVEFHVCFTTELSLDNRLRIKSNFCRHSFKPESLKVEASHSFVSATSCKSGQTLYRKSWRQRVRLRRWKMANVKA